MRAARWYCGMEEAELQRRLAPVETAERAIVGLPRLLPLPAIGHLAKAADLLAVERENLVEEILQARTAQRRSAGSGR